jgi:shikimate kinase
MSKVLITGMSGTGKSSSLQMLAEKGYRVVDTDTDQWSEWVTEQSGSQDWVWREKDIGALLNGHQRGHLFVAGCKTNQGKFYDLFDHIVLLSAPIDVLLTRIATRTSNAYGKHPAERALIVQHLSEVEPLLRATSTVEIDAAAPLAEVVRRLEDLVRA